MSLLRCRGLTALALLAGGTLTAAVAAGQPAELLSVETLVEGGGRVAWSAQGDRIAYDRIGDDGRYDLYTRAFPEGVERCLTCTTRDFRKAHALNPEWHPSGRYLVFQAQQHAGRLGLGPGRLATPDRALHSDLWLIRSDGRDFWQLTRLAEMGSAVLDPHFSHEGSTLLWAERTASRKGRWGHWRLRTARLGFRRGVPRLTKLASVAISPPGLVLPQSFTPDDNGFLVAAHLQPDQDESGLDIYLIENDGRQITRLTHSRTGLEEHARISPRGDVVAFTSDAELGARGARRTELWLMAIDGSDKRRLTRFNDTYGAAGGAYVGDFEWSSRGDAILAQVLEGAAEPRERIYLLRLSESLARRTAAADPVP